MVSSPLFNILLKLSLQRSRMGLWVVSVSGSCMSPPSLPLATGSRKNVPLSPVRFVTFILDVSFAMGEHFQNKFFFNLLVPSRNLNMWFWIWDNCLCPSGDPPAGMVKLAVDQQDHRWILPSGIFVIWHACTLHCIALVLLCLAFVLMSGYSRTWAIRLFQYQQYRATADPPIIHREKIAVRKLRVSCLTT